VLWKIQVSLPSQLERDSSGGPSADVAAVASSASATFVGQNQKYSSPAVHRDIQRITATASAARRGTLQSVLIAVVCR